MEMSRMGPLRLLILTGLLAAAPLLPEELPSIADKTAGMERHRGFVTFYWDDAAGKIWLQVENQGQDFLYVTGLATGMGSNPVGLDRGQLGGEKLVAFEKVGRKLFLVQPNLRYRADTDRETERRAVAESFAQSILWSGEIVARTDNAYLVDATSLLIRDAHGVARTLERAEQGSYSLDKDRSAIYLPRCKAFPRNTELEVTLTFSGKKPGALVRETTPTPEALTLRQHHSFIALPDGGYSPRRFDPRAGYGALVYADYAAPLDAPLEQRFIYRHRLQKRNPQAEMSEAVEPIIYYVDPGAPEPVRSALMEGAGWWAEAFEAIGYKDAFRVALLPEDADPMDVRYNVIQWVHRSTRGWSYGNSVADPRTGEIIKGHVSLGSLRVRQDRLLMEGLQPMLDGASCGLEAMPEIAFLAELDPDASPVEVALARIRQLAAHEVGHTLGLAHNFIASTYDDRASVMDYPAPLVSVSDDGSLDMSRAYGVGIGSWDRQTIRYGYTDFGSGTDEAAGLQAIVAEGLAEGLLFISDRDARPAGAAHPYASLWDNGADPVAALDAIMQVRKQALSRFGSGQIASGTPQALLHNTFVPLYLHHRFQLAATAKMLGGSTYWYTVAGDGQPEVAPEPARRQEAALQSLLATLDPAALAIPDELTRLLPPLPIGYGDRRELFGSRSAPLFDPLEPAEVAGRMTIQSLLQHERAARLEAQHRLDSNYPGLAHVIDALVAATWRRRAGKGNHLAAIDRLLEELVVDELLDLASNSRAAADVRSIAAFELRQLMERIDGPWLGSRSVAAAHQMRIAARIKRFLERPYDEDERSRPAKRPPGSPIGSGR